MALGLYISVPFCRTKCSYCNFASGVVSRAVHAHYVDRVCQDVARAEQVAGEMGGEFEDRVDSVYLGGGTPSVLEPEQLERIFAAVRGKFAVDAGAEITIECAPGTLSEAIVETIVRCGGNRVSLGVQSFIDEESRSVGRLHSKATTLDDIARLRAAGITNLNVDLIAGLPHQTLASWRDSVHAAIDTRVPHISVYMLEVDEDSRLGRELIAGGTRYHAHFAPDEDLTADMYSWACEELDTAGIKQYEISNFARAGGESRHNLKYWKRQPYLGFGVDAHSLLPAAHELGLEGVRFATSDSLDEYLAGAPLKRTPVSCTSALEEAYFLGLRLTSGVRPEALARRYGPEAASLFGEQIAELREMGLLELENGWVRLTQRGRLLSNEAFARFLEGAEKSQASAFVDARPKLR